MRHDPSTWTHKCVHTLSALVKSARGHICVPINVGKKRCRTVDADGRQHFPDHAAVSAHTWLEAGGDPDVGDLIAMDMDVHLLKGEEVEAFSQRPEARALLLTALSEVHANATMFGGIASTGFKSKWKHVDRRGRAILKAIAAREGMRMAA